MVPQAFMAGFQQIAALAIGGGAIACLPAIANSGSEEEPTGATPSAASADAASQPAATNVPTATGFSWPEFSFEMPEFPSPAEASRSFVKSSLVFVLDVMDQTQSFFAEIGESFQDLVNEAKLEQQEIARVRTEGEEAIAPPSTTQPVAFEIEDGDSTPEATSET